MTAAILLFGFFGLLAMGFPVAIALAGSGIVFAYIDGTIPMLAIVHRMASGWIVSRSSACPSSSWPGS